MSSVKIRIRDAFRQPLADPVDVQVRGQRSGQMVVNRTGLSGRSTISVQDLRADEPFQLSVFPHRYRPVGEFFMLAPGETRTLECFCPIHPDRVTRLEADAYDALADLDRVLLASTVEGFENQNGAALFEVLPDLPKAGLLNLFTKMTHTALPAGRTAWTYVQSLYRIRPDRIFANVDRDFRDAVRGAADAGLVTQVPEALHTPPPGFVHAGSFKTRDHYGNLQLTFFRAEAALDFKVDADIDDANGLEHSFQVLRNWITSGTTHPYDIHEILAYAQELPVPYRLVA